MLGQVLGRRIFFFHLPVYLSICFFLCVFTYLLKMQELSPGTMGSIVVAVGGHKEEVRFALGF